MKISVTQITEVPKSLSFTERTEELNQLYSGGIRDFRFPPLVDVSLLYYRSGTELFFQGSIRGMVEGYCGRCLKGYPFTLEKEFQFLLVPDTRTSKNNKELNQDEMGLSFYDGHEEEINLTPYVREQILLALPTRPLCNEHCRGLCPGCGVDLNEGSCCCSSSQSDPRMAFFRDIKLQQ